MEPIGWIVDTISEWIGGDPGTPRWETITAVFGWIGGAGLLGWLVTSIAGFPQIAGVLIGVFWIGFGIAFRRDLVKMKHRAKLKQKGTPKRPRP